jgi:hypothetical protein
LFSANTPALQIKKLVLLEPTNRGAVGALDIVRDDFKLGFGIHSSPIGEQQAAAELGGVGLLGAARHPHSPVEHAASGPISYHLVELIELAIGAFKTHLAVGVGQLLAIHQLQGPQPGVGRSLELADAGLEPAEGPTPNCGSELEGSGGGLSDRQVAEQAGAGIARRQ